jgi:hypothetical protein
MWDASKRTTNVLQRNEQGHNAEGKAEVKKGSPSVLSRLVDGIFASSPRLPFDFPALSLRKPERLCSQPLFFAPKFERRHAIVLNSHVGLGRRALCRRRAVTHGKVGSEDGTAKSSSLIAVPHELISQIVS